MGSITSCHKNPDKNIPKDSPPAKLDISKKPMDANLNWKKILGKYQKMEGKPEEFFTIREVNLQLLLQINKKEYELTQINFKEYQCKQDNPLELRTLQFVIDKKGFAALCIANKVYYEKVTYADKTFDFTIFERPTTTIKKDFPELVAVKEIDPTIQIDLKFTPKQIAFLRKDASLALKKANQSLQVFGYTLVLVDAYRPKTISILKESDSLFQTGNTVSVMLFNTKSQLMVDMGSAYLEYSERSLNSYQEGSSLDRWHRQFLRNAMILAGFKGSDTLWWQFTYKGVN
jgi:D-alanyl-D-alanine dipeptidase